MKVLVLGSEGQIGAPLCQHLMDEGHEVSGIDYLYDDSLDLRYEGDDRQRRAFRNADFVFFLAYDVGGSKYLSSSGGKLTFIENNVQIMRNCFDLLERYGNEFIFASSQMAISTNTPYGTLKMLGEHYTEALGGKSVRFWNVYGSEWHLPEEKWHVISDFIANAGRYKEIPMRTNGAEERQFLHVDDCSRALSSLMNGFNKLDQQSYDISSFEWNSIGDIAFQVSMRFGGNVRMIPGTKVDTVKKVEPRKDILEFWKPEIHLYNGIQGLVEEWKTLQ